MGWMEFDTSLDRSTIIDHCLALLGWMPSFSKWVNQLLQVAQKCQNTIADSGSDGVSQQDLQSNSNIGIEKLSSGCYCPELQMQKMQDMDQMATILGLPTDRNTLDKLLSLNPRLNSQMRNNPYLVYQGALSGGVVLLQQSNHNPSLLTFQSSNYAEFTDQWLFKYPDPAAAMARFGNNASVGGTAATVNAVKNSASPTPSRSNRFKAASNRDSFAVGGNNGFNQKTTNLLRNFHLPEVMIPDIGHEFPEIGFFSSDLDDYGFNWKG
ncbi:hypothetical protein Vadar_018751 [Vaccinium darrowii]|uniref:Uncharacterized protein n=1 Tax=Vaccinium darrowii TaxID=229202 RepID=A0ACB7ZKA8_9ERIC|nr:hypothetical protein Vadar_018751 [Vaccinium darrowii]